MATVKKVAFKKGDLFRVSASNDSGYLKDGTYTVYEVSDGAVKGATLADPSEKLPNWLSREAIIKVESSQTLEVERALLVQKLADIDAKLKFIKDNGLAYYDDKEYRIYQALSVIDSSKSQMEKTRKIADLLKELS